MAIRALIVDDEPVARRVLREQLSDFPAVEVVGDSSSGLEALEAIGRLKPALVFLDLQMPGMDGFDVIRHLDESPPPAVVIVTAFDEYAIRAFDAGAVDYLLKPVSPARLERCVARLAQHHSAPPAQALRDIALDAPPSRPRKIIGRLGEEFHLIDAAQVLAFQADGEWVRIVTRGQRYLTDQTLKSIAEKLRGLPFARIHRSALVNLDHVTKMTPLTSQRWLLTLSNNQEFIVSKRQARQVQELLRW